MNRVLVVEASLPIDDLTLGAMTSLKGLQENLVHTIRTYFHVQQNCTTKSLYEYINKWVSGCICSSFLLDCVAQVSDCTSCLLVCGAQLLLMTCTAL